MPVLAEKKKLMHQAADGNRAAAATLVRVYKLNTIRGLTEAVWPLGNPPPHAFDVLADAVACFDELQRLKKEPV